jgi:hypothetical protein
MAVPARALLSDLAKGHEFPRATFALGPDDVLRYLDAVEDGNAIYLERGLAPPLCAAARALGSLLELLELPAGTLHTGQELEVRGGVPIGATLALTGRLAQRSERAGMVICALDFEVTPAGASAPALRGRTTVLAPAGSAA